MTETAPPRYVATIERDPVPALARWDDPAAGAIRGPFQTSRWLAAWHATLGARDDVQPLLATVWREGQARPLLLLPLLQRREGGLRRIEFADLGVTDYAAPLLAHDFPRSGQEASAVLAALARALPPADLLCLHKCAAEIEGHRNPLLVLPGVRRSRLSGHLVTVGEDLDAWRRALGRIRRKEIERSWRVFTRHADARFNLVTDLDQAWPAMEALEHHQRINIARKGWPYLLDQPAYRSFYHRLLADGLRGGTTVLSTLSAEGEIVSALLGIRDGDYHAMLRLGADAGRWRHCSPGRLLIERTMTALHRDGVRRFDLTIGDYAYKRHFAPERQPLYDIELALSWRGLPFILHRRLRQRFRHLVKGSPDA